MTNLSRTGSSSPWAAPVLVGVLGSCTAVVLLTTAVVLGLAVLGLISCKAEISY